MSVFRNSYQYKVRMDRVKRSMRGIGVSNFHTFKATDLTSNINVDGLEELMLATWSMIQHLMTYLKTIKCDYEGGAKIDNLHISVEKLIPFIEPNHIGQHFVTDEAEAMEKVSRAAYAWLKTFRMLKGRDEIEVPMWPLWD